MKRWFGFLASATLLGACGGGTPVVPTSSVASNTAVAVPDVTTFKNDMGRTGQYLAETQLTPANVNSTTFGLLHNVTVDGKVDAQPLYLSQLSIGGKVHNVVFVATEHDSVYAIDADTAVTLWQTSLLAAGETPSDSHGCYQVVPEIGVTATPVIDRAAGPNGTLYVVANSLDSTSNYHQKLHALDVTTGAELLNGPTDISGSYTAGGNTTTFDPAGYVERAALLLSGGKIYTSWSCHCDVAPYGGWIIAFNQADLSPAGALNIAPNSNPNAASTTGVNDTDYSRNGPAIWMAGDGPAADAAGNVYLLSANGRFEETLDAKGFPNQGDFGNSFLKLSAGAGSLGVSDYFAPYDTVYSSAHDLDLGSGGELLLPDMKDGSDKVRHLVVGAGKDQKLYIVDRDYMSKFDATRNYIWQEVDGALGSSVFSSPAYFNGTLYYGPVATTIKAFSISFAKVAATPTSQSANSFPYPGTSPSVSANGTTNGIVWAHENRSGAAVLHAYDATKLAVELYNSTQASGSRDQIGSGNKFITPTVAGGKVFVGTADSVAIFGLLP